MGQTTAAGTRCPRCSAAVRPGAPWCTQCYAPSGAQVPTAAPEQRPAPPADEPVAGPAPAGTWPCTACSSPNALTLAACGGCGTPFLDALREAPPTLVLPVVGDLLALSPGRRVGVAVGFVVAFVLLTCVLALLTA